MTGSIKAVGVGLESVAQRDPRHAETLPGVLDEPREQLALILVEVVEVLRDHRGEEDGAERRTAGREIRVAERDPSGRHVPTAVANVQLGEQHSRLLPDSSTAACWLDDRVRRAGLGALTCDRRWLQRTGRS